jgi:hypothetical protein
MPLNTASIGRPLQAAEKLDSLKGTGFKGCGKTRSGERDLFALKGHDFSRADKANKISGALAPEGRSSGSSS